MKDFGHQSWVIRQTEPFSFMPMTPQPMLPSHELLYGRPAASDVKAFVQIGGWFGGLQIGIQGEASFKKPHQTSISDKASGERSTNLLESFSKFFKHLRMLNRKPSKNGHIWVMWFRHPSKFCKSKRETLLLLERVAMRFLYFCFFSSESLQEREVVSKMIPRTLP